MIPELQTVQNAHEDVRSTGELRSIGEAVSEYLDQGKRAKEVAQKPYRVRYPTNSERLNRALVELGLSAFKVHTLIWKWRGAPARGRLPFFTIRSLEKFCHLTRPTIRVALRELEEKGYIIRKRYNSHHKNTLFTLVAVRDIPRPTKKHKPSKIQG